MHWLFVITPTLRAHLKGTGWDEYEGGAKAINQPGLWRADGGTTLVLVAPFAISGATVTGAGTGGASRTSTSMRMLSNAVSTGLVALDMLVAMSISSASRSPSCRSRRSHISCRRFFFELASGEKRQPPLVQQLTARWRCQMLLLH